jgi:hypothetical protein
VERALKSCIARRTREYDFPDKKLAEESHTHDLRKLLQLAELNEELETAIETDSAMQSVLDTAQEWSETTRYEKKTVQQAPALLKAIEDRQGGLLPWLRKRG